MICAITPHGDPSAPVTAVEPRSRRECALVKDYGQWVLSSERIDGGGLRTQLMTKRLPALMNFLSLILVVQSNL